MTVDEALSGLKKLAMEREDIRQALLETRNAASPVSAFCRLAGELGFPICEMDLVMAGEEYYAAMRRSTNGGGENSPLLEGEDDYYEIFMAQIS